VLFTIEGTPMVRASWANADAANSDPAKAIAQSVFFTVFPPESFTSLLRVIRQNVLRNFIVEVAKVHGEES
jgi:hypothetical protein